MKRSDAKKWVREHDDDDVLDERELAEVFAALYGREPDQDDENVGLWSLCCAAV